MPPPEKPKAPASGVVAISTARDISSDTNVSITSTGHTHAVLLKNLEDVSHLGLGSTLASFVRGIIPCLVKKPKINRHTMSNAARTAPLHVATRSQRNVGTINISQSLDSLGDLLCVPWLDDAVRSELDALGPVRCHTRLIGFIAKEDDAIS